MTEQDLTALRPLAKQYPTLDAAVAEVARLSAERSLPKGTIHVISDIHGDDVKLRHVINNASGQLRPVVEKMFGKKLNAEQLDAFMNLIFYPRETLARAEPLLAEEKQRRDFCQGLLRHLFEVARALAPRHSRPRVLQVLPPDYADLMQELLYESGDRGPDYYFALLDSFLRNDRALHLIHMTVRVVRNLAIDELIIGGDCWDRGPRGDRVVDYLMRQPEVAFIWGNHDAAWLGAGLGQEACVMHVLRISTRYRRLSQLEEGYGITLQPLEHLVQTVYADDPASCYKVKGVGLRADLDMMRLQKAAAVMQFKLEGQMIARNPEWGLDHRRLLHRIDWEAGTVDVDRVRRSLKDKHFPTIDPDNPYELSPEEKTCLERTKRSFYDSEKLWAHIKYLVSHGSMYLVRDRNLIFHGCVPVDGKGEFLSLEVDGKPYAGRALFDALDRVIARSTSRPSQKDKDLMWYLWCGARSPLFGKDRIATFEIDLVAEPETHTETKNPYFALIHEVPFCDKVLQEFGVDAEHGLIVNGHVPVKVEKGENPLKRSGKAITIDGAFSAAYGDHGYTLVLEPTGTLLAKHHHFESVDAALEKGVDIVPEVTQIRRWETPRRVADTERGAEIDRQVALLERLIEAYRLNKLPQA